MAAARFCSTCGALLSNGSCAICPVPMYNAAPQSPSAASTTQIAAPMPVTQGAAHPGYGSLPVHAPGARYVGMWNWGAFLLCPFWLMNHGRVGRGILYIVLSVIPLVSLAALGMAITYGIKGNAVAATSRRFVDDTEFVAVQNAWRNWGFGLLIISVALGLFAGIVGSLSGSGH